MPKRTSKEDVNRAAARILQAATAEEPQESTEAILEELQERLTPEELRRLAAAILGREGGKKGGKSRAEKLTPERRSEIARKAAEKRWSNKQS